jgi:AraC-like DNA-binding protein
MDETLLHFFMFYGPVFSLVIAIGQVVQKKKRVIDYVFSSSFFGLSLWLFQMCLYSTGSLDAWSAAPALKLALIPATFIVPPLMAFRYRWIISSRYQARPAHALYFLPALVALVLVSAPLYMDIPVDRELLGARPIFSAGYLSLPGYYRAVFLLFPLPKIFLVLSLIPVLVAMSFVWKRQPGGRTLSVSRTGYVFAALITVSNALAIAGDFYSIDLLKAAIIMANASMSALYLATQRHADYTLLLKNETRQARYERSRLRGLDVDSIVERLYELMEDEKAFADEDLTLAELARELAVGPHQLSQILNERIRKNFNTFVNEYRVAEARQLLVDEPDRSILSIGVAAGFNSVTTFNTVFSKSTGLSPSQYRKSRTGK